MNPSLFYRFTISIICLLACAQLHVQGQTNASIPGDFPDPTIIEADGRYYAVGTSSEWAPHLPIYSSDDLTNWKHEGFILDETPEWAGSSFWAPEYVYHNGLYYLYYSAKRKSDGVSCIGVATSRYPNRGFVDQGIVVDYGTESIDAFVVEQGEERFMTWKAYGLDDRPIELVGSRLADDGLSLEGEVFTLLMDTAHVGIEGQAFIQKDGYYYMFYSIGACCGTGCDYHVKAVRSREVQGPYEPVGETVLLGETDDWQCMGHGTFVKNKQQEWHYLFHGYSKVGGVYTGREGLLARLLWSDTHTPVFELIEAGPKKQQTIAFDFQHSSGKDSLLQWDFRHMKPEWSVGGEGLHLSGQRTPENQLGIVLTTRPWSKSYSIQTEINREGSATAPLGGLTIYGDVNNSIGMGVQHDTLLLWKTSDKGFVVVAKRPVTPAADKAVQLRIDVQPNLLCRFYYRGSESEQWIEWTAEDRPSLSIGELPPWDRSPRPGLHMRGTGERAAVFRSMRLSEVE